MSIKFTLSRLDLFIAYNLMQLSNTLNLIFLLFFFAMVIFGSFRWAFSVPDVSLLTRILSFAFFMIIPLLFLLILLLLFTLFFVLSSKNKVFLVEQYIKLEDEMLISVSEYGRSEILWKTIQRVSVVGNYCFIYLSQIGACIIPKKAFTSDQEWRQFVGFCRSKMVKK
jgi:hypothetical protein